MEKLSKDDNYYTPLYIIKYFGGDFNYDPATTADLAKEFNIRNYDTIETDGLKRDWTRFDKIWCNPPFSKKKEFLAKAVSTMIEKPSIYIYMLLPIEFLTTRAFHDIVDDTPYVLHLPRGRINFTSGKGKKTSSPAFGSVILEFCYLDVSSIETLDLDEVRKGGE